ncbi:MAG: hypothetical protein HYS87_02345 [Candidatus Colwellbacteria bacterium]|nr:hypothetical protein [Candidatus Colwellbacteria bacterium]
MKKRIKRIIVVTILVLALISFLLPPTFGATEGVSANAPKILPANPFYFIKEVGRGVRSIFTFNSTDKVEYELKVADVKALEVEAATNNSNDPGVVAPAVRNFRESVEKLKQRFEGLELATDNARIDALLNFFAARLVKHTAILHNASNKFKSLESEIIDAANSLHKTFITTVEMILNYTNGDLKAISIIDSTDSIEELMRFKNYIIMRFEARVKVSELSKEAIEESIESLGLSEARKLKIINELRERAFDEYLKSNLSIIKTDLIKTLELNGVIEDSDVQKAITEAEDLIESIADLQIDKARFNLLDAQNLLRAGSNAAALSSAQSAYIAARSALEELNAKDKASAEFYSELKAEFDRLASIARSRDITRENNTAFYELLEKVEKLVLGVETYGQANAAKRVLTEIEARLLSL